MIILRQKEYGRHAVSLGNGRGHAKQFYTNDGTRIGINNQQLKTTKLPKIDTPKVEQPNIPASPAPKVELQVEQNKIAANNGKQQIPNPQPKSQPVNNSATKTPTFEPNLKALQNKPVGKFELALSALRTGWNYDDTDKIDRINAGLLNRNDLAQQEINQQKTIWQKQQQKLLKQQQKVKKDKKVPKNPVVQQPQPQQPAATNIMQQ